MRTITKLRRRLEKAAGAGLPVPLGVGHNGREFCTIDSKGGRWNPGTTLQQAEDANADKQHIVDCLNNPAPNRDPAEFGL